MDMHEATPLWLRLTDTGATPPLLSVTGTGLLWVWVITLFLCLQPFPAASLLPGGPDQQQALPQDGSSADISDLLKLRGETRFSSRVPDPPQSSALSVTSGALHIGDRFVLFVLSALLCSWRGLIRLRFNCEWRACGIGPSCISTVAFSWTDFCICRVPFGWFYRKLQHKNILF